jgi:6,7-dimethyl-8-ribityllumazine synthase
MNNIVIICTSYHRDYIERMLKKVHETAEKLENIEIQNVFWVPGVLEIPYAIRKVEKESSDNEINGYVVLGIIEKGETDHGLIIGQAVIKHLIKFQTKKGKPVGVGIIGPGVDPKQIEERIEMHAKNAILAVEHLLKEPSEWK